MKVQSFAVFLNAIGQDLIPKQQIEDGRLRQEGRLKHVTWDVTVRKGAIV